MHAFALPGLGQMPCENDTSTPALLFHTDAARSLWVSSFVGHNVGCWEFCCCWACAFFFYFAPRGPPRSVTHPQVAGPRGSGEQSGEGSQKGWGWCGGGDHMN